MASLVLIAVGMMVGAFGTLIGAGGGFLVVPYLILVNGFSPQAAIGTSLTMVFFNALSGTAAYARQKRIDYVTGLWFALATIPGAVAGAYLSRFFSGRGFAVTFAVLLLLLALFMFLRPAPREEAATREEVGPARGKIARRITDARGRTFTVVFNLNLGIGLSFLVGFLSSILGIGGGIIHVPMMVYLLGWPAHLATATSHFILVNTVLFGAGSHYFLGHVHITDALPLALGAVAGAQIGARWSVRIRGRHIVRWLSLALVLVALRLILG